MSDLANYSIETDHTVLLAFKDGRKLRVPVGQLAHHLNAPDLERVRASIKLRRDFIRRHMPKVALLVAATGLVGILTVGTKAVAQLINPPHPKPASQEENVVRNQIMTSPAASPLPSPAVKGAATVAAAVPSPAPSKPKIKSRLVLPKVKLPIKTPQLLPSASPSPSPSASPSATPESVANGTTPTDQTNKNGQILGCQAPDPCTDKPSDPGPLAGGTPLIP